MVCAYLNVPGVAEFKGVVMSWLFVVRCFVLLVMVSVSIVGCDDLFDVLEKDHKVRPKSLPVPGAPDITLPELDNGFVQKFTSEKKEGEACVKSICPLEISYLYEVDEKSFVLSASEREALPESTVVFESKIWPSLANIIESTKKRDEKGNVQLEQIKAKIPQDRAVRVDDVSRSFIKYLTGMKIFTKYNFETHYDLEYFAETNKVRLKKSFANTLSKEELKKVNTALAFYNRFLQEYVLGDQHRFSLIEDVDLRTYILSVYGNSDFETSKKKFLSEVQGMSDRLKSQSSLFHKIFVEGLALKKLMQGKDLLRTEEIELSGTLLQLTFFSSLIKNGWPEIDAVEVDFESLFTKDKVTKIIDKFMSDDESVGVEKKHKASMDKTYGLCKQSFSAYLASLPSQKEIDATQGLITSLKNDSKSVAKQFFKDAPTAQIANLIDTVKFSLPYSKSEAPQKINIEIQALKDIAAHSPFENIEDLTQEEIENLLGMMVAIEIFISDVEEEGEISDEYSDINDFCLKYRPKGLSDFAVTIDNRISTSARAVKSGKYALGILAHELGHRLHYGLGTGSDQNLKKCLKDRYAKPIKVGESTIDMSLVYLSEDFADRFSTELLKSMGLTGPENNFACIFSEDLVSAESEQKLSFYSRLSGHPLAPKLGGVHSSGTFRLIQVATDLGHITPTCKSFANKEKGKKLELTEGGHVFVPKVNQCNIDK